ARWERRLADVATLFIAADTGHRYVNSVFQRHAEAADVDTLQPHEINDLREMRLPWSRAHWRGMTRPNATPEVRHAPARLPSRGDARSAAGHTSGTSSLSRSASSRYDGPDTPRAATTSPASSRTGAAADVRPSSNSSTATA